MVGLAAAVIDAVGDEVDVAFDCHWRYQVSDASAARARARAARADVARGPGPAGERAGAARGSRSRPRRRSPPARTATCATASARRSSAGRSTSPRPTRRRPAACSRRAGSPTTPTRTTSRWRRTASRRRSGRSPTSTSCAAIPNFLALEWHGMSVPFWNDLASGWDGPVIDQRPDPRPRRARPRRDAEPRPRARVRAARRAVLRRVMIAATYSETGGSDVLDVGEVDTPPPGPGRGARAARGGGREPDRLEVPRRRPPATSTFAFQVPGQDGAGVVEAVGEGVAKAWVGERVWVYFAAWQRQWGTAAQYTVVPVAQAVPLGGRELRPRRLARHPRADRLPLPVRRRPDRRPAGARRGRRGSGRPRRDRARHAGAAPRSSPRCRATRRPSSPAPRTSSSTTARPGAAERIGKVDRIVEVALGPNLELDLAVANPHAVDHHLRGRRRRPPRSRSGR